jgi:SpoVK/Ycf46/Vps4 family AAA+-type ATPase
MGNKLFITGIPSSVSDDKASLLRTRLLKAVGDFLELSKFEEINITVSTNEEIRISGITESISEGDDSRSSSYNTVNPQSNTDEFKCKVQKPSYDFDQLILPREVEKNILITVEAISVEEVVFNLWGLSRIQPNPRTVLNFYGPPGTGKTLAAHAIASRMRKSILLASYADIESKFHGEGPKNLQSIFRVAERENAVLFIDEADSLLSRRLTEVNSGSEQAINSMRSQLLICLEQFKGVAIFATNLIENYDKAFGTRVRNIKFLMPGMSERERIWRAHLPNSLPLDNIDLTSISEIDEVCGRDIREAVIDAAIRAALRAKDQGQHPSEGKIRTNDLIDAIERKKNERVEGEVSNQNSIDIKRKIEQQISSIGNRS